MANHRITERAQPPMKRITKTDFATGKARVVTTRRPGLMQMRITTAQALPDHFDTSHQTSDADSGRSADVARYAAADLIQQLDAAAKDASYWAKYDLRDRRDYHAGRAAAYRDAVAMVREQHNASAQAPVPDDNLTTHETP